MQIGISAAETTAAQLVHFSILGGELRPARLRPGALAAITGNAVFAVSPHFGRRQALRFLGDFVGSRCVVLRRYGDDESLRRARPSLLVRRSLR